MLKFIRKLTQYFLVVLIIFIASQFRIVTDAYGSSAFSISSYFQWGTWTPTTNSNGGTWSLTAIQNNYYIRVGNLCFISLYYYGTLASSGAGYLTFTLPVKGSDLVTHQYPNIYAEDNAVVAASFALIEDNSTTVRAYKENAGTWGTTGAKHVSGNFFYRCG